MATTRIADLIAIASRISGVSKVEIKGQSRLMHLARIRQAVAHVAVSQGVHSTPQIGKALGGRDHSTIIHANRRAIEVAKRDSEYAHFIKRIRDEAEAAEPFLVDWGEQFEFALPKPKVIQPPPPKPKRQIEEPIYYGGSYSMNRDAAA